MGLFCSAGQTSSTKLKINTEPSWYLSILMDCCVGLSFPWINNIFYITVGLDCWSLLDHSSTQETELCSLDQAAYSLCLLLPFRFYYLDLCVSVGLSLWTCRALRLLLVSPVVSICQCVSHPSSHMFSLVRC